MAPGDQTESLRERTRRAVQKELVDAALQLFVEQDYETVTVEQIAAAAGLSKRSFFRYFSSKDALILGKYDRQGEDFASALAIRPAAEPAWVALRRMFDGAVAYIGDPALEKRAREVDRIIAASELLRSGYLERLQRAQRLVAVELRKREGELSKLEVDSLVAAAFAAMSTAYAHSSTSSVSFEDALDVSMRIICKA